MEKYERTIGLKTIWLTFVRRWKILLIIFVPATIVTLLVTQLFIPKQYQSSATLSNTSNLNAGTHSAVQNQIKKETTLNKTSQYLQTDYSISLSNDKILNGLSFVAFSSTSPTIVSFSYTSGNKSVVKPVMESLKKATLEELANTDYKNMFFSSSPSEPKRSDKVKTYLLIGLAASLVLGLGIAFVDEIVSDEVYDEDEIELLGSPSYGLIASKK